MLRSTIVVLCAFLPAIVGNQCDIYKNAKTGLTEFHINSIYADIDTWLGCSFFAGDGSNFTGAPTLINDDYSWCSHPAGGTVTSPKTLYVQCGCDKDWQFGRCSFVVSATIASTGPFTNASCTCETPVNKNTVVAA